MWNRNRGILRFAAAAMAVLAAEAPAQPALEGCARIDDNAARLACYDTLAAREKRNASADTASKRPQLLASPVQAPSASELEKRWELRPELRQGTFKVLPYRPLYALVHATSEINAAPNSPTRPFDVDDIELDTVEAKLQLSFKSKLVQDAFGFNTDVWFGYTQQSYWQAANERYSSPFRETNYQPEAIVLQPIDFRVGGANLRYATGAFVHESNGRGGALSRSWNRLVGSVAFESGPWSLELRPWLRVFDRTGDRDDNPDIEDYVGRGELVASWRDHGHVVTLAGRHSLRSGDRSRGSLRVDWAFPLAGSLNGHLQLFHGYGENLIDYNHRQTMLGVGVSFFD